MRYIVAGWVGVTYKAECKSSLSLASFLQRALLLPK